MGRPPLGVKPTMVRLTEDVRRRIVALVGENRMAAFIREAVDAELARREKLSRKLSSNPTSPSAKLPDGQ